MNIPFEIGETVFVVDEEIYTRTKHTIVGYDHLGAIGGEEYQDLKFYKVKELKFSLSLLGKYNLDRIFKSKTAAEIYKKHLWLIEYWNTHETDCSIQEYLDKCSELNLNF